MAKTIKLGARVEYRDSSGFAKLGLITGTADTVQENNTVPALGTDEVHIFVLSPTGKTYHRQNVSRGTGPKTFTLL